MIDEYENRLSASTVQPVRGGNRNENTANQALPGDGEQNSNSEPPPSYEEVMEQPSLFNRTDFSFREDAGLEQYDEVEEGDDDENDDTAALLGS